MSDDFVPDPLHLIEYFSGSARISKLAHAMGYQVRAFDVDYDHPAPWAESSFSGRRKRSSYDINGEAGIVFLMCKRFLPASFHLLG